MGSDLGECIKCGEWTDVEEFDEGLICSSCYEDLLTKAGELTEPEQ